MPNQQTKNSEDQINYYSISNSNSLLSIIIQQAKLNEQIFKNSKFSYPIKFLYHLSQSISGQILVLKSKIEIKSYLSHHMEFPINYQIQIAYYIYEKAFT
ncbi:hypothetical protein ABPG72_007897 [Tetrahymena utriculariae]